MSKKGCSAGCAHAKRALRRIGWLCQNPACAREGNVGGSHSRFPRRSRVRISQQTVHFFEQAFRQHNAVEDVTRVYDRQNPSAPRACRLTGVFLVDAYDMSAADVRHACDPYGAYDVAVKMNSHGSVTGAAERAAASMGATLKFGDLMGRSTRSDAGLTRV